jgi:hypothetical protein
MKPGDLRRFKGDMIGSMGGTLLAGQTFVVLDVYDIDRSLSGSRTDFLIGGRIETRWNAPWIEDSSEVLDEAG